MGMSPSLLRQKRNVTPFYFRSFFERDLAELRGVSVEGTSQAESSGDRPGLREVVAVKALSRAGDSERERRRKIKIRPLKRCSKVMFLRSRVSLKSCAFVNLHLVINGPNVRLMGCNRRPRADLFTQIAQ